MQRIVWKFDAAEYWRNVALEPLQNDAANRRHIFQSGKYLGNNPSC
jgi:hypothetical protein